MDMMFLDNKETTFCDVKVNGEHRKRRSSSSNNQHSKYSLEQEAKNWTRNNSKVKYESNIKKEYNRRGRRSKRNHKNPYNYEKEQPSKLLDWMENKSYVSNLRESDGLNSSTKENILENDVWFNEIKSKSTSKFASIINEYPSIVSKVSKHESVSPKSHVRPFDKVKSERSYIPVIKYSADGNHNNLSQKSKTFVNKNILNSYENGVVVYDYEMPKHHIYNESRRVLLQTPNIPLQSSHNTAWGYQDNTLCNNDVMSHLTSNQHANYNLHNYNYVDNKNYNQKSVTSSKDDTIVSNTPNADLNSCHNDVMVFDNSIPQHHDVTTSIPTSSPTDHTNKDQYQDRIQYLASLVISNSKQNIQPQHQTTNVTQAEDSNQNNSELINKIDNLLSDYKLKMPWKMIKLDPIFRGIFTRNNVDLSKCSRSDPRLLHLF